MRSAPNRYSRVRETLPRTLKATDTPVKGKQDRQVDARVTADTRPHPYGKRQGNGERLGCFQ